LDAELDSAFSSEFPFLVVVVLVNDLELVGSDVLSSLEEELLDLVVFFRLAANLLTKREITLDSFEDHHQSQQQRYLLMLCDEFFLFAQIFLVIFENSLGQYPFVPALKRTCLMNDIAWKMVSESEIRAYFLLQPL
jgi:hypothetical protein